MERDESTGAHGRAIAYADFSGPPFHQRHSKHPWTLDLPRYKYRYRYRVVYCLTLTHAVAQSAVVDIVTHSYNLI